MKDDVSDFHALIIFRFIYFMWIGIWRVCMCTMCGYGAHGGQERVSDHLELDLWKVTMWVLGIEPRSLKDQ